MGAIGAVHMRAVSNLPSIRVVCLRTVADVWTVANALDFGTPEKDIQLAFQQLTAAADAKPESRPKVKVPSFAAYSGVLDLGTGAGTFIAEAHWAAAGAASQLESIDRLSAVGRPLASVDAGVWGKARMLEPAPPRGPGEKGGKVSDYFLDAGPAPLDFGLEDRDALIDVI